MYDPVPRPRGSAPTVRKPVLQPGDRYEPERLAAGSPRRARPARPARDHASWAQDYGEEPPRRRASPLWAMAVFVCVLLLCAMGLYVAAQYEGYTAYLEKRAALARDTFFDNITVDGVSIGGLTMEQARAALAGHQAQGAGSLSLTVQVDGDTWRFTQNDIPFTRNTDAVLRAAYAIGRQGSPATAGASVTPFEYRYQHARYIASQGAHLYTQVTYDKAQVRALVEGIAQAVTTQPVDAMIASFDFSARAFTFTQEAAGKRLDTELLYNAIIERLDAGDYTAVIQTATEAVMPAMTRVELMNSFSRVSGFATKTTSNANRNNNIQLAANAVSGVVVLPGATFSFNETTGERTTKKGYLPAAAISGGVTVDEVGGGVCQVSSTLFNAVSRAGLEIVSRTPHAWPSDYVEMGCDATVDWPYLDFKFKNNRETPIFIVAYYENRTVTVEIYGMTLGAGESIDLQTETVSTTRPPSEPIYQQNPELPAGTQKELKKARTGYVVNTYRVYLRNGVEYKRELLCKSTYKMVQQVIEYN